MPNVTTLIKKHTHATLVNKEDIKDNFPSLTRDGISGISSLEQSKRFSVLIWMNWRVCYAYLESL